MTEEGSSKNKILIPYLFIYNCLSIYLLQAKDTLFDLFFEILQLCYPLFQYLKIVSSIQYKFYYLFELKFRKPCLNLQSSYINISIFDTSAKEAN